MSFELFIALRYLMARRKQAFISLISLISTLGVTVGVMALLIALALMTGLQGELRDRIIGSAAHVYVFRVGGVQDPADDMKKLRAIPRVQGAAPVVLGKAILSSGNSTGFVDIKGIDPSLEKTVTQLASAMRSGSLDALNDGAEIPGILLGTDLAKSLDVQVGDSVEMTSTRTSLTPMGPVLRKRVFKVVGIFSLGL